jgi:hypothetical protein
MPMIPTTDEVILCLLPNPSIIFAEYLVMIVLSCSGNGHLPRKRDDGGRERARNWKCRICP